LYYRIEIPFKEFLERRMYIQPLVAIVMKLVHIIIVLILLLEVVALRHHDILMGWKFLLLLVVFEDNCLQMTNVPSLFLFDLL